MPSTYINLVNKLLRRVREAQVEPSDFENCRNVQAVAKDAIVDTVNQINKQKFEWPFNAVEHSQNLQVGVSEYAWPTNFKAVDWNTFQIQPNEEFNISHRTLKYINRDDWYRLYRDRDEDRGTEGNSEPYLVFPAHGNGFGVSPSPDKLYRIEYRYYRNPTPLVNANDVCNIPDQFEYVIINGALRIMNLFLEDPDGSQLAKNEYLDGIREMTTLLINQFHSMSDTRLNRR